MSFNPNLPADDTYISSVASILRSNFTAMVQGDTSFSPLISNLTSIENAADPEATETQSRTFLKKDQYGNLNIFTALPNAQSGAFAQTLLPPLSDKIALKSGTLNVQYTSLLGGFLLAYGMALGIYNQTVLPLTAFSSINSIVASRVFDTNNYSSSSNTGVTLTPVSNYVIDGSQYTSNPKNTFSVSIGGSYKGTWNCSIIAIGVPDSKFLAQAFSSSGG